MEQFEARYIELMVHPDHVAGARSLKPMSERQLFGRSVMLFDQANRAQLAALGDVRTPNIADLFVAIMGNSAAQGARSMAAGSKEQGAGDGVSTEHGAGGTERAATK